MPSLLLFAAPAFAQAEMDVACDPVAVLDTVPLMLQEGVPVDARPAAIVEGSCGGADYLLELFSADAEEPLASAEIAWSWDPATTFVELPLEQELLPDTDHVFRISAQDGWSDPVEVPFRTGSGHVQGVEGVPELGRVSASSWERGSPRWVDLSVEVRAAEDPDSLSLLHLLDPTDGETVLDSAYAAPGQVVFLRGWWEQAGSEACATVVQVDGTGTWGEPQERCAVIEDADEGSGLGWRLGCATGGLGSSLSLAMLGLAALLRRR